MNKVILLNVLIASPGDLEKEREQIKKIIQNFEYNLNGQLIRLNPLMWENDMPSTSGKSPQAIINETMLPKCDILVGIFYTRFGTKTDKYDSGTVEEIETFIASNRPVILYFYTKAINPATINAKELQKIGEFKERYKSSGIYKNIKTIAKLQETLVKDLEYNLTKVINNTRGNEMNQPDLSSEKIKSKTSTIKKGKDTWWSDESITEYINEFITSKNISAIYEGQLTFYENVERTKGKVNIYTESTIQDIMNQARRYAFDKKYGNYDYTKDLRQKYNNWFIDIRKRIDKFYDNINNLDILGVGSNLGKELIEIFPNDRINLSVLDISIEAIEKGKKLYPQIEFYQSDMEREFPISQKFDICLALRSIQSRGISRQNAIMQMEKILKPNGLLLITVPNGYITSDNQVLRGLYDHRNKLILERRPQTLADKILNKLIDYNFKNTGIETLDTEILIWGQKSDD